MSKNHLVDRQTDRTGQARPDQTRPDQARPDQTRPDHQPNDKSTLAKQYALTSSNKYIMPQPMK